VVPPPDEKESEIWAALEYAVYQLGVSYLIVMGHDGCGGIKSSFGKPPSEELQPFLHHWVTYMESSKNLADGLRLRSTRFASVVRTNVIIQIERIRSHPLVYAAIKSGDLALLGLVYNAEGELEIYDEETEDFLPISLD
jgi:carbonic anhydrase